MRCFPRSLLIGVACLSTACLSTSHEIGKTELQRLSQSAPETRGERVRVVQGLGHTEGPPAAEGVQGNTVVVVRAPIWIGGRPHRHRPRPAPAGNFGETPGPAGGNTNTGGGAHGNSGSPSKSSGTSGSNLGNVASGKKDAAKALLIVAAAAALGLAVTEGARYDGWVRVHPMHPVHLYGPGGYTVLPLAHIDPQTAAWASHGYIRENEGPFDHLGRAPLNRQGLTYSIFLGSGEVPVIDFEADPGFAGHIQFGYFFTKQVGLQFDLGMAWTADDNGNTIYNARYAAELQTHLVKAGPIHAGLFGQLGQASRFDDGIGFDDKSGLYGGGALLQLELTTRLALTGRVGSVRSFGEWSKELGVGVSIY